MIKDGLPIMYYLPQYGGKDKIDDARKIDHSIDWLLWCGGEFIGGLPSFFSALYDEIMQIKDKYWEYISDFHFHIGDEVLTTMAVHKLFCGGRKMIDGGMCGCIHRYWSPFELRKLTDYEYAFIHLPADKVFISKIKLNSFNMRRIKKDFFLYNLVQRFKGFLKKMVS